MMHVRLRGVAGALVALMMVAGCSRSSNPSGSAAKQGAQIVLNSDPHPKMGASTVSVTVRDADGRPVDGAAVSAEFFMPAMASMGKTTTQLKPQGNGRYDGLEPLSMAGSWQMTVTAKQGDTTVASKLFNLVAKE